jgi:hypothetical protein
MSDVALFTIGTLVFFLGGAGLVLYGLDTFQTWIAAGSADDEDRHLEDETIGEAFRDPTRRRH